MVALAKPQPNTYLPMDEVIHGNCLDVLRSLPANSVDAIVSDPPAGINFMQKEFDSDRGGRTQWVAWLSEIMTEALRCLKPGGYGLIWALPRTSHWTALALEDSGFLVKDCITHIQGQGFPKSMDISKAIDKMQGAEREVIGKSVHHSDGRTGKMWDGIEHGRYITAPATPEAQQWNGYGTALKPSTEFWWLVQKPISEKTIAANVLRWGTGGINVDGCRVAAPDHPGNHNAGGNGQGIYNWNKDTHKAGPVDRNPGKRFPSHLLLSHSIFCVPRGVKRVRGTAPRGKPSEGLIRENGHPFSFGVYQNTDYADPDGMEEVEDWECVEDCPIYQIGLQSGIRKSGGGDKHGRKPSTFCASTDWEAFKGTSIGGDTGSAARYFQQFSPDAEDFVPFHYFSKSSRRERNAGCEGLPEGANRINAPRNCEAEKFSPTANSHPTVKSLSLMRWLCRLITPPDGIVLDPFGGSGSTALGCISENKHFILIEQDLSYCTIAEARIAHALKGVL